MTYIAHEEHQTQPPSNVVLIARGADEQPRPAAVNQPGASSILHGAASQESPSITNDFNVGSPIARTPTSIAPGQSSPSSVIVESPIVAATNVSRDERDIPEWLKLKEGIIIGSDEWRKDVQRRQRIINQMLIKCVRDVEENKRAVEKLQRMTDEHQHAIQELQEHPLIQHIEHNWDYYSQF